MDCGVEQGLAKGSVITKREKREKRERIIQGY
jgi:hypothetical protein